MMTTRTTGWRMARMVCCALALHALPAVGIGADAARRAALPAPVRLDFEVTGVISSPYSGSAELVWTHDGRRYQSQLHIRKFGLTLQTWTSQGTVSESGLEPEHFTSKRLGQAEISARLDRARGRVSFSEGTPQTALQAGAQDQLSVYMHLAYLLAADSELATMGQTLALQAIGDRYAEQWTFTMEGAKSVTLGAVSLQALKWTQEPSGTRKQRLEVWYAPSRQFLPVRIRITEANGDYLDLVSVHNPIR